MKTIVKMTITGEKKKAMETVADVLGTEMTYAGMPSAAYEAGGWSVDRNMLLTSPALASADAIQIREVLGALVAAEYTASGQMTIEVIPEEMDVGNIDKINALLASKASLIKKAFDIDVEPAAATTNDGFSFDFYGASLAYADVISAIQFSVSVHDQAALQKRVTGKDKPSDNEKYDFRTFLNRLGCTGFAYKTMRKTLGNRLSGNSAFRSGVPKDSAPADTGTSTQSDAEMIV